MLTTATCSTVSLPALSRSIPTWFGALVVTTCWLLARPYLGLRHDGILYAGQALLHMAPVAMSHDIFFVNGSQDSFSVVSPLLAAMYSRWGLDVVQIVLPALSQAMLAATALFLLRPLPALDRWLGLVALAVLSHVYGGLATFAFAERFLTARTLAEPLALAALALLLHNRLPWAALFALAAAALHPLVALPALIVGWLLLVHRDRRWAWAGLLGLLPLLLAWMGLPPFTGLLAFYDDDWWHLVDSANRQVLVSHWRLVDWQVVVMDLGVLTGAALMLPAPLRRLTAATAVATVGLLAISAIGADGLRNVLVTQLQVWRVLWLAHLLCLACLPALGMHLWRRGPNGKVAMLALATAVVAVNGSWAAGWVFLLCTVAAVLLLHLGQPLRPSMQRLVMAALLVALLGLSMAVAMSNANALRQLNKVLDLPTWLFVAFMMPTLSLPLAAALYLGWVRGQTPALLALIVTVGGLLYAASIWDQRSAWIRYVETSLQREHPFAALIPETAQVYWHENLPATWLVLRRASYISTSQAAGLLFNRDTALEYQRRHDVFLQLELQAQLCSLMAALGEGKDDQANCVPTEELVRDLCAMERGPDFMIFERRLPKGVVASWTFNSPAGASRTYHLYDCKYLR